MDKLPWLGASVKRKEDDRLLRSGEFSLQRYVLVHDCGTQVNPMIVEGQAGRDSPGYCGRPVRGDRL